MNPRITDYGRAWILSPWEWEVLEQISIGNNTKTIALNMHLSEKRIEGLRSFIYRKTGYRSQVELCRFAIRIGLIEP